MGQRRKRVLDPRTLIDFKDPEGLKRFITDRGKIIPRRISGASSSQQRKICKEIKRARYMSLLPFSIAHRNERKQVVDAALAAASAALRPRRDDRMGSGGRDQPRRDERSESAEQSSEKPTTSTDRG